MIVTGIDIPNISGLFVTQDNSSLLKELKQLNQNIQDIDFEVNLTQNNNFELDAIAIDTELKREDELNWGE